MPRVRFIYLGDKQDFVRESVVTNVVNIISTLIKLPESIEIQFQQMNDSTYGEVTVDYRFRNRISLNEDLSAKESILPAIHELIHVSQMHEGKLVGRRDGSFLWNGKVHNVPKNPTYQQWMKLPWEVDVVEKQHKLMENVLKLGTTKI